MGLKSGSRDAGLDESDEDEQPVENESSERDVSSEGQSVPDRTAPESDDSEEEVAASPESQSEDDAEETRPTMSSIPYKLRREKVNEGREQVPYFLRSEIIEAEEDLQDALEEMLGENVYKSDYREAAMVVAQRRPELIAEVLREWGYDLETR